MELINNEIKRELIKTFLEKYGELYISIEYDMIADKRKSDILGDVYIGYSYYGFEDAKTTSNLYKVSKDFFNENFIKVKDLISLHEYDGWEFINYNFGEDKFELASSDELRLFRDFKDQHFIKLKISDVDKS